MYSTEDAHVCQDRVTMVPTGLKLTKLPPDTYVRVAPRSGLAAKHGVQVLAGVIDPDYRGEIKVLLTSVKPVDLPKGDRVAQLVVEQVRVPDVKWGEQDDQTQRGGGGFGSTGQC